MTCGEPTGSMVSNQMTERYDSNHTPANEAWTDAPSSVRPVTDGEVLET